MINLRIIVLLITSFITLQVNGQQTETIDFTNEIKDYNISHLLTADTLNVDKEFMNPYKTEPLGYIGSNYQRFYIHFISVLKNPIEQREYFVYGKTKVSENICSFQGKIKLLKAKLYIEGDTDSLKQGFIIGEYVFYEDVRQKGSGLFKGKFKSNFHINDKNELSYDEISFAADGYKNNQFEGTWQGYNSDKIKICNWGDYRIPNSNELDIGAGEFSPSDEYIRNGWQNYQKAWLYNPNELESQKAKDKELEKWWITE